MYNFGGGFIDPLRAGEGSEGYSRPSEGTVIGSDGLGRGTAREVLGKLDRGTIFGSDGLRCGGLMTYPTPWKSNRDPSELLNVSFGTENWTVGCECRGCSVGWFVGCSAGCSRGP